jgi:hypothetical protein
MHITMRKRIFVLALIIIVPLKNGVIYSQETENGEKERSIKVAEICKMVDLDLVQIEMLASYYDSYIVDMDSAINKTSDKKVASALIYKANMNFNSKFMDILSDKQKAEYVRNASYAEIMEKTKVKVKKLRQTEKYTEQELDKFTSDIFDYLMLEKIAYVCDKYNIERQKENIAQLKKYEPQALKTANALEKAKHQGVTYQNGYRW